MGSTQTTNLRTYYTLIATQVLSVIGSRISGLAVSIWVFNETGAVTPLALVMFFALVPQIVLAGVFGAIADRFDRRTMMILADTGQAIATLALLASFASGAFQIWHLYVVAVVQAACGALQGPALQASITMLVPDDQRTRANAIGQMIGPTAGVIAPAIAGLLYALIGVVGAILIDLATFVIAVAVIFSLKIPQPPRSKESEALQGSLWSQAFDGYRYLGARPALLLLCLYIALVNFLVSAATVLNVPFILERTESEAAFGLVVGIVNVGAIAGGVICAVLGARLPRIHTLLASILCVCICLILTGMAQNAWTVGLWFFLLMAALPFANAPVMSMLQAKVAPDVQGRVFAAISQLNQIMMPIAFLSMGPLADHVFEAAVHQPVWAFFEPLFGAQPGAGMGLMFAIGGLVALLLTLAAYAAPTIRNLERIVPDHAPESA
jgi:DHA3 family macrolide efflux protein-like MFS transporter